MTKREIRTFFFQLITCLERRDTWSSSFNNKTEGYTIPTGIQCLRGPTDKDILSEFIQVGVLKVFLWGVHWWIRGSKGIRSRSDTRVDSNWNAKRSLRVNDKETPESFFSSTKVKRKWTQSNYNKIDPVREFSELNFFSFYTSEGRRRGWKHLNSV